MPAYTRIKDTEGNFSEWISNLLLSYDNDGEEQLALTDALRRRIKALESEFKRLYDNNGVVRRECRKDAYRGLEMIGQGDI